MTILIILYSINSLSFTKDKGRLLENAIYIYLRQLHLTLFYFREKGECDFVVFDQEKCVLAIQVCEEIHSDNKDREISGILEALRFFNLKKGIIVTKNQKDDLQYDDIEIELIPWYEFVLKSKLL